MKAIRIVLAVFAFALVAVSVTVTNEVINDTPTAEATLVGCSIEPVYSGYGLRYGSKSICTQTYGAAGEQRARGLCYDGDNDVFYYKYGAWVKINKYSGAYCNNTGDVMTQTIIQHRNI